MVKTRPLSFLSGNVLKLLAAALMVVVHIGVIFFPYNIVWRCVGRVSMPLFAYLIAEGCRYTRSAWGYLGKLFACLVVCQVGNYVGTGSLEICILGTFLLGASLLFCLQNAKRAFLGKLCGKGVAWTALFVVGTAATYYVNQKIYIDYGFWACMLPVFAGAMYLPENAPGYLKKWDNKWTSLLLFSVCLALLVYFDDYVEVQIYCLLALPLLAVYSGRRGTYKLKYFFYLFYPGHLALLEGIYLLLSIYAQ
jgi:hypothetical protein